ncbi:37S ribosomal protein mrp51 [Escovopsis weberi]|uniref:37S ribosomal protein mrp51 n=1 Tax=Escovopsis weberi TaxID=150374 RepID=A0A0M9VVM9_ESCWE|nr:37S ribosomal protein mrp51 [Escovopsis weberi]
MPKPLPEPPSTNMHIGDHKSNTMTRRYPQHQSITSPLSSREKGDWGLKRSFPLKSTMATSTPLIRIKQLDTIENVTDFASAADHSLSLQKFQEMKIAMAVPAKSDDLSLSLSSNTATADLWPKSVFEEDSDFTDFKGRSRADERRWKFQGPWLARMADGDFNEYLDKKVRPKRAIFRELLKRKLARDITAARNRAAAEEGAEPPPRLWAKDITDDQFTQYLHSLRNDRVALYSLVSKFLDLAPLGQPAGFVESIWAAAVESSAPESPYGKSGPPPCHPSAGISYLRTGSFMENHPVYGPQANRAPTLARMIYPRVGPTPAKLGVGGFVANAPVGESMFNRRTALKGAVTAKTMLNGINFLDTTTLGGAKAYVEAQSATVDPSGKVVLQLRETTPEAQLIAKESKGQEIIYHEGATRRYEPRVGDEVENWDRRARMTWIADEMMAEEPLEQRDEKEIVSSSSSYGLGGPTNGRR